LLDDLGLTKQQLFDNKPLLTTVLLYHLINQEVFAADVLAASEIFPMESESITVDGVLVPPAALQLLGD
jgi:uncharacterized surface protein with fasciclin (FAS1) repeats